LGGTHAIEINWQLTGGVGIMQVKHTADCFESMGLTTVQR